MQGLHLAQLLSVNVGQPREITWRGKPVYTSEHTMSFSVQSGVRSMNEVYPLERAAEAYDRIMSGKARFRVVLTM